LPVSSGTPKLSPLKATYETLLHASEAGFSKLPVPQLYNEFDRTDFSNPQSSERFHGWLWHVPGRVLLSALPWWLPNVYNPNMVSSLYKCCEILGFFESVDGVFCLQALVGSHGKKSSLAPTVTPECEYDYQ